MILRSGGCSGVEQLLLGSHHHQAINLGTPDTHRSGTANFCSPASLTLEQQHITAIEGIVPTLQNIVVMVSLDFGQQKLTKSY